MSTTLVLNNDLELREYTREVRSKEWTGMGFRAKIEDPLPKLPPRPTIESIVESYNGLKSGKQRTADKLSARYVYDQVDGKNQGWPRGENFLELVYDNVTGHCSHLNYLDYLSNCWASHLGVVINPDFIWYTLLCEITSIMSKNQATYRSLFTTSPEKEEICFHMKGGNPLPSLNQVISRLKNKVPTELSLFLPKFSTTNENTYFAKCAALSDIVSPYYDFRAFACGIPSILIEGEESDWKKLRDSWKILGNLFVSTHQEYIDRVYTLLDQIISSFKDRKFWHGIVGMESQFCDDTHILGWFTSFFVDIPKRIWDIQRNNHVSSFKYKVYSDEYEMKTGLFSSTLENGYLRPEFSQMLFKFIPESGVS